MNKEGTGQGKTRNKIRDTLRPNFHLSLIKHTTCIGIAKRAREIVGSTEVRRLWGPQPPCLYFGWWGCLRLLVVVIGLVVVVDVVVVQ